MGKVSFIKGGNVIGEFNQEALLPEGGSVYLQNLSIGGFGRVLYDPPILGCDVTLCHNAPWS